MIPVADRRLARVSFGASFVALLVIRLVLLAPMTGPRIAPDEHGYLLQGRYLASVGATPVMDGVHFYTPGYSLLIAPIHALLREPGAVYRAVLVTNVLILGVLFIALYLLARKLFELPPRRASLVAAVASAYPAYLLHSALAMAESFFVTLFCLWGLALLLFGRRRDIPSAVLVGSLTSLLYLVHPRAISLPLIAVLAFALLAYSRQVTWITAIGGISATVASTYLARVLIGITKSALWGPIGSAESDALNALLEPHRWPGTVVIMAGRLWYLVAATLGLAVLGAIALWRTAVQGEKNGSGGNGRRIAALGLLVGALGIFVVSTIATEGTGSRADHYIYGRYNEGFLAVFILAGLSSLLRERPRVAHVAIATAGMTALSAVVVATRGSQLTQLDFIGYHALGVDAAYRLLGDLRLLPITAVAAILMLTVTGLRRVGTLPPLLLIALIFLSGTAVTWQRWFIRDNQNLSSVTKLREAAERLGPIDVVDYDRDYHWMLPYFSYQFWLPETRFELFHSQAGWSPVSELVIRKRTWEQASARGARVAYLENHVDQALWVLPGPRQDDMARRGLLLPLSYPAALPAEAYRSRIRLLDPVPLAIRSDKPATLEVRITHDGDGSPWPGVSNVIDGSGAVRLAARWLEGPGAVGPVVYADLPRMLYPGESADLALHLPSRTEVADRVEPGPPKLELMLLQQGIGTFPERGDAVKLVDVVFVRPTRFPVGPALALVSIILLAGGAEVRRHRTTSRLAR